VALDGLGAWPGRAFLDTGAPNSELDYVRQCVSLGSLGAAMDLQHQYEQFAGGEDLYLPDSAERRRQHFLPIWIEVIGATRVF